LLLTDLFIFSMSSIYQTVFRLILAAADAYDARSDAKFKHRPQLLVQWQACGMLTSNHGMLGTKTGSSNAVNGLFLR
jgi:hypothetical protein